MKKCIKIILNVLLTVSLILITMSFIIENIVVKTFSQEILAKKVSGYFLDEVVYDVDINTLGIMENNIRNSQYTTKITSKFIQTIVKNVVYNENIKFDISNEIDSLILENMPKEFYNEKVNDTKEYLSKNMVNIEKNIEEDIIDSAKDYYLPIFKIYSIVTNIYFRIGIILMCILIIIGLAIIEKGKTLKTIQISSTLTMLFTIIAFIIIKLSSNFIDQTFAGGRLSSINLELMLIFIIIEFIISVVLFIIRKRSNL